ncbi:PBSX family phage terminase large subunit [Saccharothrix sp. HUAS TT1]|uniref:PBSX family phage terminase large subunit n=1 Tax=unclassified Saccharothrix TaxID=2593673 RepID=UPI00345C4543
MIILRDHIDLRKLPLSYRQIDYVVNSNQFVNLSEGSVRSGKTASGLFRWLKFVNSAPRKGDLIVCAKTFDTATRNIFNPLREHPLFGSKIAKSVSYTRGAPTARILGREVEVITFNDERAEGRLRGLTAAGAYVDEWSLMPRSFNDQLLSRCSTDGAQIFGNTNPDNPRHWLKADYIDQTGSGGRLSDWKTWKFLLDDNPSLSERVKERYRRQFIGLWYKRMILGQWVVAEGAIYEAWDPERHVVKTKDMPHIVRWIALGIDYGTTNPFAGLVLGLGADGRLYLTNEWRWDSKRRQRALTDAEYSARLRSWLGDLGIQPEWTIVDPSAASFIQQLYRDGVTPRGGDNSVIDGIRLIASLLNAGLLLVHESCEGWIEEVPGYSWDPKAALKGEDKPIKLGDHSLDGGRYAIKTTQAVWQNQLLEAA